MRGNHDMISLTAGPKENIFVKHCNYPSVLNSIAIESTVMHIIISEMMLSFR